MHSPRFKTREGSAVFIWRSSAWIRCSTLCDRTLDIWGYCDQCANKRRGMSVGLSAEFGEADGNLLAVSGVGARPGSCGRIVAQCARARMRRAAAGDFGMKVTAVGAYGKQLTRLGFVNCFLVREDDGYTLIDANLKGSEEEYSAGGGRGADPADSADASACGPCG